MYKFLMNTTINDKGYFNFEVRETMASRDGKGL